MILSEHLVRSDTDDQDYNTPWYRWTIGRLQQVFLAVSRAYTSLKKFNVAFWSGHGSISSISTCYVDTCTQVLVMTIANLLLITFLFGSCVDSLVLLALIVENSYLLR